MNTHTAKNRSRNVSHPAQAGLILRVQQRRRLPAGLRRHVRAEKARIRRTTPDKEEAERMIKEFLASRVLRAPR